MPAYSNHGPKIFVCQIITRQYYGCLTWISAAVPSENGADLPCREHLLCGKADMYNFIETSALRSLTLQPLGMFQVSSSAKRVGERDRELAFGIPS